MKTFDFNQLTQAVADHDALWVAFLESERRAADVTGATIVRIAADRDQVDERTTALVAQSRDLARPEVVRRLALQELERLQSRTFEPTPDERAAFDAAMDDAKAALRDARTVHKQLRDLFVEADKALSALRAGTLGDQSRDVELAERRLDGEERSFSMLGKTSRPGGQS